MEIVELIYAPPSQAIIHYQVPFQVGMCVADLIAQSGVSTHCPETEAYAVGIFSKQVSRDTQLAPGDRVEIYRPLLINPKDKRRQRAAEKTRRLSK